MKTVAITGGTGFVGQHISALLIKKGYNVIVFTRNTNQKAPVPGISYALWNPDKEICDTASLAKVDVMVHLAGAGVAEKRWTEQRKKEIVDSRVKSTDFLIRCLKDSALNCKTFIAASATGIYGDDTPGNTPFTESTAPSDNFLANTCKSWETSSLAASHFLRTVILRIGIVMGKEGGAFPQFEKPVHFGIMPVLGNGNQVVSWIAIEDLAELFLFSIQQEKISGIYNAVAPNPVSQKKLISAIAGMSGCIKIHVPSFMLKLLLGEMSTEILKSCTVSAQKISAVGFKFKYPEINMAIKAITTL